MAMQYHPDRNKDDKNAEAKFKEVNEAYQTLSESTKRKNYDQFGSADGNPFGGMGWNSGNAYRSWPYAQSSWGFEDIFSQFWWSVRQSSGIEFDLGDLFWGLGGVKQKPPRSTYEEPKQETIQPNLDVMEIVEIPFFDFLYDTSVNIRTVYGKNLSLKVKAGTKPGTKFKISGKWRTIDGKTGDMYVTVDAKMPKEIPENLRPMLEAIRYQI